MKGFRKIQYARYTLHDGQYVQHTEKKKGRAE